MKFTKNILLGLTTTPGSDWRGKIREIDELGLKEVALFPTFLNQEDRKILYTLLEGSSLENIPHVHLRDDMEEWELDYLVNRYKTRLFNIHPYRDSVDCFRSSKYVKNIYVENLDYITEEFNSFVGVYSGLCVDFSHWEDSGVIQGERSYNKFKNIVDNSEIGCCHISGVRTYPDTIKHFNSGQVMKVFSWHNYEKLSDFDYILKYVKYLPDVISLELENSFKEQILARNYILKMINDYE